MVSPFILRSVLLWAINWSFHLDAVFTEILSSSSPNSNFSHVITIVLYFCKSNLYWEKYNFNYIYLFIILVKVNEASYWNKQTNKHWKFLEEFIFHPYYIPCCTPQLFRDPRSFHMWPHFLYVLSIFSISQWGKIAMSSLVGSIHGLGWKLCISLVITFHWLDLSHMVLPNCCGGLKMGSSHVPTRQRKDIGKY